MNSKIKEIVRDSRLDVYGLGKDYHKWDETVSDFANQLVGETILAILATDTRSMVYTTYDKSVVDAVIGRVIDSVRDHFKETENV
jgi:hypothetical protein